MTELQSTAARHRHADPTEAVAVVTGTHERMEALVVATVLWNDVDTGVVLSEGDARRLRRVDEIKKPTLIVSPAHAREVRWVEYCGPINWRANIEWATSLGNSLCVKLLFKLSPSGDPMQRKAQGPALWRR